MARRYSRSDKEKWTAAGSSPPPPPRRAPVRIPASDPSGLIAENKLTIIGRITNPRFQRPRAVIDFLPQVWNLEGRVVGRELGIDKFQFRFESEQELQTVLDNGPYHYKRWMLILQRWEPVVAENFPSQISFWVKINGIPLHYWNEKAVETISDQLGRVSSRNAKEAKFRVEVNGLQPLEMKMEILLPSEEVTEVEFQYLKIEKHCFTCFSLLHEEDDCPSRPRGARAPKDRILGITQAYALQRIEAEKQRHNDRRGYVRPDPRRFVPKRQYQTGRDDHRHYSVNRDSRSPPKGPVPVSHYPHQTPLETPAHSTRRDDATRTPEAPVSRGSIRRGSGGSIADGQIIYPVNQNPSGGLSSPRERIPARDRLSGQSNDRIPARERLSGGEAQLLLGEEVVENELETEELHFAPLPPISVLPRLPASQRLRGTTASGSRGKAKSNTAAALSKQTGKRKVSKPSKQVLRSPLQVFSLAKSAEPRSKNPPRRRLVPARYATEFAGTGSSSRRKSSSKPNTVNIPEPTKERTDFRSLLPPLP